MVNLVEVPAVNRLLVILAIFGVALGLTTQANADISIGSYTFANNAFADQVISSTGTYALSGGASSLAQAVLGSNVNDSAYSLDSGASVTLGFTDNVIVNGPGNDVVLFELGIPDTFKLTINSTTISQLTTFTGATGGGFNVNAAAFDLTAFGIAPNATISSILIGMDTLGGSGTAPSLTAAGALNSASAAVPEPSSLAMMSVIAAVGLAGYRRRLR